MKVVGIIPAHLASVRFPKKILFDICGLPMIEHVRRRALLSKELDDVLVATCDAEIVVVLPAKAVVDVKPNVITVLAVLTAISDA